MQSEGKKNELKTNKQIKMINKIFIEQEGKQDINMLWIIIYSCGMLTKV